MTYELMQNLQYAETITGKDSVNISYNQFDSGYLWICCTNKLSKIYYNTTGTADFTSFIEVYNEQIGKVFYCYRTANQLITNQWDFTIEVNVNKEGI